MPGIRWIRRFRSPQSPSLRLRENPASAFFSWQARIAAAVAAHPGFLSIELTPAPGGPHEWRMVVQFRDAQSIDYGPGYRVYFMRGGPEAVVLLCGGDKGTQDRDIARAKALAEDDRDGS